MSTDREVAALGRCIRGIELEAGRWVGERADHRAVLALEAMARARLAEHGRAFDEAWADDLDFEVLGPRIRDPLLSQDHSYVLRPVALTERGERLLAELRRAEKEE